jgi:hypothetical protein
MSEKLDPKQAVHLKPNRRRLPRFLRRTAVSVPVETEPGPNQWVEHRSDCALDAWGTAIRDMKKAGTWTE